LEKRRLSKGLSSFLKRKDSVISKEVLDRWLNILHDHQYESIVIQSSSEFRGKALLLAIIGLMEYRVEKKDAIKQIEDKIIVPFNRDEKSYLNRYKINNKSSAKNIFEIVYL